MNKDEKIKELIDIILKLKPSFKKNIGKNRVAEALKSGIKLATNQQNTRIVSDLEEYNFVKRERDPNNKRIILAYETEAGRKYYHDLFEAMNKAFKEMFLELDDDILDELLYHFKAIFKLVGQIG